jgi:Tol biopolymer transport system component
VAGSGSPRAKTALITAVVSASIVLAGASGTAHAAWPGENGRIAFEVAGRILSIQPSGAGQRTLTAGPDDHAPRWSPDGKTIVFERSGDLWLMRADGSDERRLTSGPGDDITPGWSPDGTKVVFVRSNDGSDAGRSILVKPVAGGLPSRLTPADDGCAFAPTWTSTGRYVVYADICSVPFGNDVRKLRKVDTTTGAITTIIPATGRPGPGGTWEFGGTAPDVSPDGRTVAFKADIVGADPCYIATTDLSGGNLRVITSSGDCGVFASDDPAFSPDGRKLTWTAGNENPQLDVIRLTDLQGRTIIWDGNSFPFNSDWQPRH